MADQEKRDFAAWKFQTIDLLITGLGHREARVAICLLGHMNRVTRLVKPSQRRIAILLGMDESAVRRAIKVLVDSGVLEVERANRQHSNQYSFSTAKMNEFFDLRRDRLEEASRHPDREDVSAQNCPDEEEAPSSEEEEAPSPDREEVSPKHLNGTIEGNHQESVWIDREVLSPAEALEASEPPRRARSDKVGQPIPISDALRESALMKKRDPIESLNQQFGSSEWPKKNGTNG